jgi:flagellar biogenesis protein FliO
MGVFTYIMTMIGVVLLAFLTTRYISKVYTKGLSTRSIKVVERINLAADKSLWLVEFGSKQYFLYTDRHGMTKLDTLDIDFSLRSENPLESTHHMTFENILDRLKNRTKSNGH